MNPETMNAPPRIRAGWRWLAALWVAGTAAGQAESAAIGATSSSQISISVSVRKPLKDITCTVTSQDVSASTSETPTFPALGGGPTETVLPRNAVNAFAIKGCKLTDRDVPILQLAEPTAGAYLVMFAPQ